jgi:peptide/nickel transport system ATP-binding protein/oligopeptide transport system ATP-binding protein
MAELTTAGPEPVLRIRDLRIRFRTPGRRTTAVSGIDLEVGRGEILGVVGETGCGKTVTGLSVLGLLPETAEVEAAELRLLGRDLLTLSDAEWRKLRGTDVAMVFQNPSNSFNPVFTLGAQMRDVLAAHEGLKGSSANERVREVLTACALPDPDRVMGSYPHQLSGGMLQRAMLGLSLLSRPKLLIADEPTTALDVTIAAQILELLLGLQQQMGFSVLFITHDLGVVRRVCSRVAVLYAGRVVETAPTAQLFAAPQHPYTCGLIAAVPRTRRSAGRLATIPGSVPPDPGAIEGCAFRDRCELAIERCATERPLLRVLGDGQQVACHVAGEEAS